MLSIITNCIFMTLKNVPKTVDYVAFFVNLEKVAVLRALKTVAVLYWYEKDELYLLCGNPSRSTKCPNGYVCWKDRVPILDIQGEF
ncbi:unnamed protein product [Adineta steineri]|uniref:Uncharacterized protein n=1 Tax=Adineta steineri TaxID=433720 RepID=A0A819GLS8_9BILA|nr:unnamed protein product [Adineta steineri]